MYLLIESKLLSDLQGINLVLGSLLCESEVICIVIARESFVSLSDKKLLCCSALSVS